MCRFKQWAGDGLDRAGGHSTEKKVLQVREAFAIMPREGVPE